MMPLPTRKYFNPVAIVGLLLYVASFAVLLRNRNFEPGGALIVLVLFGIIFPALAWLATLRAVPLSILVHPTPREMLVLVACVVALSAYLVGGPQWINDHLPQVWIDSPRIKFFITLAKKLIVFVLIPFGIFRFAFGYRLRDFGIQQEGLRALRRNHLPMVLVVGGALLAFQFFLGNGAAPIREGKFTAGQLLLGLPLCFAWLVIEVGLVEEFFFRALVQSRLAAWFKSEVSGVVLMSLVFGLAHAPGFIFRGAGTVEGLGANPSALEAAVYSIVVLAVSGILFGVIWAQTRNLIALMLLHAAGDLLPNFAEFVNIWQLAK
jgi:membrane protease YdiL (CAAX protease family)